MSGLAAWQTFFTLVGSSAGALIGLQFVLIALIADLPTAPSLKQASGALGTPIIVHFSVALLLSAALVAPWREISVPATGTGVLGLAGAAYALDVIRQMRRQTAYRPDPSDWFFYAALPLATYVALALSAFAAASGTSGALFGVGAASLTLLFIGIRNSWDSVTYHVFVQRPKHRERRAD